MPTSDEMDTEAEWDRIDAIAARTQEEHAAGLDEVEPDEDAPDDAEWSSFRRALPCGTQSSKLNTIDQFQLLIETLTRMAKQKRRTILWNTVELETEYETYEAYSLTEGPISERIRVMKVGAWTTPWKSSTGAAG